MLGTPLCHPCSWGFPRCAHRHPWVLQAGRGCAATAPGWCPCLGVSPLFYCSLFSPSPPLQLQLSPLFPPSMPVPPPGTPLPGGTPRRVMSPRQVGESVRDPRPGKAAGGGRGRDGEGGPGPTAGHAGFSRPPGRPRGAASLPKAGLGLGAGCQAAGHCGTEQPPATPQLCLVLKINPRVGRNAVCALCLRVLPEQAMSEGSGASPATRTAGLKFPPLVVGTHSQGEGGEGAAWATAKNPS